MENVLHFLKVYECRPYEISRVSHYFGQPKEIIIPVLNQILGLDCAAVVAYLDDNAPKRFQLTQLSKLMGVPSPSLRMVLNDCVEKELIKFCGDGLNPRWTSLLAEVVQPVVTSVATPRVSRMNSKPLTISIEMRAVMERLQLGRYPSSMVSRVPFDKKKD